MSAVIDLFMALLTGTLHFFSYHLRRSSHPDETLKDYCDRRRRERQADRHDSN